MMPHQIIAMAWQYLQTGNLAGAEAAIREALKEAAAILPVLLEQGAERAKNRLHTKKETG